MNSRARQWLRLTALSLGLACGGRALALGVFPTQLIFTRSGDAQQELRLLGNRLAPVAVELSVLQRSFDRDHTTVNPDQSHCLALSLPQLLVDTEATAVVQVSRTGPFSPCDGKSFYVLIETLPVATNASDGSGQLRITSRLFVPVHIAPREFKRLAVSLDAGGGTALLNNPSSGPVLYASFALELYDAQAQQWRQIPGRLLARHFRSDALLAGERQAILTSAWLPASHYTEARIVASTTAQSETR